MSKNKGNPDWKDLIAPFAWLITRVLFRLFKKRWVGDPHIPVTNKTKLSEDADE